jgi:hypothetical protein
MSGGPEEVPRIENPAWFGQDFPSEGKLVDKLANIAAKVGDWTAKIADFADVAGLPGPLDPLGAGATAVNQYSESTVQNPVLRGIEAGIAGAIDFGMGLTPLGPVLPALDSAASMLFGVSPGDMINNGLRAGFTAAEGAITGNRQGPETLEAKNIAGDYGKAMQKIVGG